MCRNFADCCLYKLDKEKRSTSLTEPAGFNVQGLHFWDCQCHLQRFVANVGHRSSINCCLCFAGWKLQGFISASQLLLWLLVWLFCICEALSNNNFKAAHPRWKRWFIVLFFLSLFNFHYTRLYHVDTSMSAVVIVFNKWWLNLVRMQSKRCTANE